MGAATDGQEIVRLSKEHAEMKPIADAVMALAKTREEMADLETMTSDPEMAEMAADELQTLKDSLPEMERGVALLLAPRDADEQASAVLEVRAGTGGDEAALFAGDLFRMYSRYAQGRGWRVELDSATEGEAGGYKEIIATVSGKGVFSRLKFESGVHRVQRVPATEASGRIHTSAATVAVLPEAEEMAAAVGAGDLRPTHVANVAQQMLEPKSEQLDLKLSTQRRKPYDTESDIQILGVGKLKTQVAKCCKPLPGDPIGGYITVGRGVTVHRQDCITFLNLKEFEPNRIIEVSWGGQPVAVYPVDVEIEAYDRSGLLRDITQVLSSSKSDVLALNPLSNKDENTATMTVTLEISSLDQLAKLLAQIRNLPNIIDVRRKRS